MTSKCTHRQTESPKATHQSTFTKLSTQLGEIYPSEQFAPRSDDANVDNTPSRNAQDEPVVIWIMSPKALTDAYTMRHQYINDSIHLSGSLSLGWGRKEKKRERERTMCLPLLRRLWPCNRWKSMSAFRKPICIKLLLFPCLLLVVMLILWKRRLRFRELAKSGISRHRPPWCGRDRRQMSIL